MIPTVLLIEDDPTHSSHITDHLRGADPACRVIAVTSAHSASDFLQREKADCALLDYALPDANGLDFLAEILQRRPGLPVIIVTAAGSEEVAVSAMKLGAADYVVKHGRYLSNVARAVADVLSGRDLPPPAARLRQVPDLTEELKRIARRSTGDPFRDILGTSPALQGVKDRVRRFAGSDETILIDGETGSGKELVARAIHDAPPRARPFVAINCARVPETLLESELFGHERGAFTGAERARRACSSRRSGGTLFLDEIGEMPLALAGRSSCACSQEREVPPRRRHATRSSSTCASSPPPTATCAATSPRALPRGSVLPSARCIPLTIPPLRERREDIPLLVEHSSPAQLTRGSPRRHRSENAPAGSFLAGKRPRAGERRPLGRAPPHRRSDHVLRYSGGRGPARTGDHAGDSGTAPRGTRGPPRPCRRGAQRDGANRPAVLGPLRPIAPRAMTGGMKRFRSKEARGEKIGAATVPCPASPRCAVRVHVIPSTTALPERDPKLGDGPEQGTPLPSSTPPARASETSFASSRRCPAHCIARADAIPGREIFAILESARTQSPHPRLKEVLERFRRQWTVLARRRYRTCAEDVEDAIQETLDALTRPEILESVRSPEAIQFFATRTFANRLLDEIRHWARMHDGPDVSMNPVVDRDADPAEEARRRELVELIRPLIEKCPTALLRYIEGLPIAQIAKETGLNPRTVHRRLARFWKMLRETMADETKAEV